MEGFTLPKCNRCGSDALIKAEGTVVVMSCTVCTQSEIIIEEDDFEFPQTSEVLNEVLSELMAATDEGDEARKQYHEETDFFFELKGFQLIVEEG